ncbi:hypothetical protein WDU94_012322 [Cyamophila willieti]
MSQNIEFKWGEGGGGGSSHTRWGFYHAVRTKSDLAGGIDNSEVPEASSSFVVYGDSHCRELGKIMQKLVVDNTSILCNVNPGRKLDFIIDSIKPKKLPPNCKLCLIAGTNDLFCTKFESVKTSLEKLFSKCKDINLYVVLIPPRYDQVGINTHVRKLNVKIKHFCSGHNNVQCIDPGNFINFSHVSQDGVHLNKKGKNILCTKLVSKVLGTVVSDLSIENREESNNNKKKKSKSKPNRKSRLNEQRHSSSGHDRGSSRFDNNRDRGNRYTSHGNGKGPATQSYASITRSEPMQPTVPTYSTFNPYLSYYIPTPAYSIPHPYLPMPPSMLPPPSYHSFIPNPHSSPSLPSASPPPLPPTTQYSPVPQVPPFQPSYSPTLPSQSSSHIPYASYSHPSPPNPYSHPLSPYPPHIPNSSPPTQASYPHTHSTSYPSSNLSPPTQLPSIPNPASYPFPPSQHPPTSSAPPPGSTSANVCEIAACSVKLFDSVFMSVYRSPSASFEDFCNILESALQKIFKFRNVIIAGDFNVHFGTHCTDERIFLDLMSSYGFLPTIFTKTRGDNCLDNFFINFQHSHDYCVDTIDYGLSDHSSQKIKIQMPIFSEQEEVITHRPVTPMGKNYFFQLVSDLDFGFISSSDADAGSKFQMFHDLLRATYNLAFPLKQKKVKKCYIKSEESKWFTPELGEMRKIYETLNLFAREEPTPLRISLRNQYRIKYRAAIKEARTLANDNKISHHPCPMLPILSKVYERVIKNQIVEYFESNALFSKSQFGFRKNKSTSDAINCLVDSIVQSFENKEYAAVLFCDISKAFDTLDHGTLLGKLSKYNFDGQSISYLKSYLSDRQQCVRISGSPASDTLHRVLRSNSQSNTHSHTISGGNSSNPNTMEGCTFSSFTNIMVGVPQGSVLGPLLFLIYINDLPGVMNEDSTKLFADDSTFIRSCKELTQSLVLSEEVLNKAEQWFSSNSLFINRSKTQKVIFSLRNMGAYENPVSVQFLGVLLQPNLCWDSHIDHIAPKINKNIYLLRNLALCVSPQVLRTAYFGLIHSYLSYAVLAWGHSSVKDRAFSLQRKAIRIVGNIHYRAPCQSTFQSLCILTFPCLYIYNCLIHIKTHESSLLRNRDVHDYETRHRDNIRGGHLRLKRSQNGTLYWGSMFYNKLPPSVRELPLKNFCSVLQDFLVARAYFSIQEYLDDITIF